MAFPFFSDNFVYSSEVTFNAMKKTFSWKAPKARKKGR